MGRASLGVLLALASYVGWGPRAVCAGHLGTPAPTVVDTCFDQTDCWGKSCMYW